MANLGVWETHAPEQLSFWESRLTSADYVYFIQSGSDGPVKIGRSIKPKRRLPQLQTGNPDELILRHVIPGDLAAEQRLHHHFEPARIRGEWFGREYLPIILAFAGGLADRMIHTYDGSGTPPEMSGGDVRTAAEIQRIRRDIECLWRAGHDIDAIAEYTRLEVDEVEQHLAEMRQSMIWDVQTPGGFYGRGSKVFPTGRGPVPDGHGDRPRHKAPDDESLDQID